MLTHVACPSWGTYTLIALTTVTTNSSILTGLTCTISVYKGEQQDINNSAWSLIYTKISKKMSLPLVLVTTFSLHNRRFMSQARQTWPIMRIVRQEEIFLLSLPRD